MRTDYGLDANDIKKARKRQGLLSLNTAIDSLFPFVAISSLALVLALLTTLALVSNRPDTNAMSQSFTARTGDPAITLITDNAMELFVQTTQNGSVSSVSTDVRVIVDGANGYALLLNTATPSMQGQNGQLSPINASIASPGRFDISDCNSWGFATSAISGDFSSAFDASYAITNSQPVSNHSSNYAAVPTVPALIRESSSLDETTQFFFAACVNNAQQPDSYSATITWTAISVGDSTLPPAQDGDIMQNVGVTVSCPTDRTWVVDARDNRTYWIRYIPDTRAGGGGLCWMETNLAYSGGGSWDSTMGWPDDRVTLITHAAGTGMGNVDARVVVNSPSGNTLFTTDPTPPSTASGGDSNAQYGFFYNWCAAMGGPTLNPNACNTTSTPTSNPPDQSISICPAGWRLPTAGPSAIGGTAQNNNQNEFWNLNQVLNSGLTNNDVGLRNNWLVVLAGFLNTTGSFVSVGSQAGYWSSTISSAASAGNLLFNFVSPNVLPANVGNKAYGFSVRCVQDEPPIAEGSYMQEVTLSTCPNDRTMVVDARDNNTYWIRRIPNTAAGGTGDLCWMETNLAYAGGGNNTFGDAIPLIQHTAGTSMGNVDARFIPADNSGNSVPNFTTNPTLPSTGSGASGQYGFLYNWCGAMGGLALNPNACNLTSTTGQDVNASVCPDGWRLPTAGVNGATAQFNNTNEFWNLNQVVNGGSASSPAGLLSNWLGVYAGFSDNGAGNPGNVGTWAYYWSSTISNAASARHLLFNSTSAVPPANGNKANGFSVRCVLD